MASWSVDTLDMPARQTLQVDLAYPGLARQINEPRQFVQTLSYGCEPERNGGFAGMLRLLHGRKRPDVTPDLIKSVDAAHPSIHFAG